MITATTIEEARKAIKKWKAEGLTVGLVPTMGALHDGHASLVTAAVSDCDRVVTSVFVNPTQFGEGEDLESYPRDFERDCKILEEKGCHMVFHPSVQEMYPDGYGTYVNLESEMTKQLCGRSRPGHFRGVCTVVSKLFNITTPDRAYFGQKDAQQLAVIRRMVKDMDFDIEIVGCPTVREKDGLAKSSRNSYLNDEERQAAAVLYRSIEKAKELAAAGASGTSEASAADPHSIAAADLLKTMTDVVSSEPMARIDYIEAVDGHTLMPKEYLAPGDLVAMAVYIGDTRLIDNFTI
ncbi:MAG: pantoate--beta-alanine ligase [Anaerovoracaceae bacterium]|nr:pantoate--beta-alanine ligase [Anaerovoracaceae bacterium]